MQQVSYFKKKLLLISIVISILISFLGSVEIFAQHDSKLTNTSTVGSWTLDPNVKALINQKPEIIREKLQAAMKKLLKEPKVLEIDFSIENETSQQNGRFKKINVRTERGEADGLVLHKADIEFNDVQLDINKLILEEKIDTVQLDKINMDVTVLEADLNAFLEAKSKKIKVDNPRVEMSPGHINLSGSTRYSFMKVKFWATGYFAVNDSKTIWFHPKKLKVNNMTMPRAFVGNIVKRINPVLNLEKFPFKLNLQEIQILKGALRFTSFRKGQ